MLKKTIRGFVERLFTSSSAAPAPKRFSREDHGINPRHVSAHAVKVCEVLHEHGHEAYIVGGAVRDLIIGLQPKDFDVATNATPEQIRPLFRRARIIGRRFRLVHVVFGREIIETSTFRASASGRNVTDEHGRILRDNLFGTHEEDAARRDFTFNALYYDPLNETVIDFHDGLSDLQNRIIRIIGEPEQRYREDPVRMLRAMRFAAKLDARIDDRTLAPIHELAPLVRNVPSSRLFDELLKLLTCGQAMACLRALREAGLHHTVLPLLDQTLALDGGEAFLELAMRRTDARIRSGRTASPGFLFAALLWPLANQRWSALSADGTHPNEALIQAADEIIGKHSRTLPIQRRFVGDLRDIWFMQARFERASPRAIWRMLEQPRFRAAVDFLQLRAEAREVDSVMAQWWMDLANASHAQQADMIEALQPRRREGSASRRRRGRRRRPAARQATPDSTHAASGPSPHDKPST